PARQRVGEGGGALLRQSEPQAFPDLAGRLRENAAVAAVRARLHTGLDLGVESEDFVAGDLPAGLRGDPAEPAGNAGVPIHEGAVTVERDDVVGAAHPKDPGQRLYDLCAGIRGALTGLDLMHALG